MSQAPTDQLTARGYEPPLNTQFSVFLDNRVGKLRELVEVFNGHALQLASMVVLDAADHAVVRVLTSRADLARRLLERAQLPFSECEMLVVEIDAARGRTLGELCTTLLGAEINLEYLYPLLVRPQGRGVVALRTDDQQLAGQLLRKKLFNLMGENDLGENAPGSPPSGPIEQN
ncbi:MAG: hypothetical protein IT441_11050 [Phycisphaeraceae bacterium]|nr:hypothetical protein [Phycisphaeraceae bacterium]